LDDLVYAREDFHQGTPSPDTNNTVGRAFKFRRSPQPSAEHRRSSLSHPEWHWQKLVHHRQSPELVVSNIELANLFMSPSLWLKMMEQKL
jgi:hypothetical protein